MQKIETPPKNKIKWTNNKNFPVTLTASLTLFPHNLTALSSSSCAHPHQHVHKLFPIICHYSTGLWALNFRTFRAFSLLVLIFPLSGNSNGQKHFALLWSEHVTWCSQWEYFPSWVIIPMKQDASAKKKKFSLGLSGSYHESVTLFLLAPRGISDTKRRALKYKNEEDSKSWAAGKDFWWH